MLNSKIQLSLNNQVNAEFYSAYLYLSMAAYFEAQGLKGMSHWMKRQAEEEISHGMKIFNYIYDRGGRVTLTQIETPPSNWKSPLEVFQESFKHETHVTKLIHDLVKLAQKENDIATESFLDWFVQEQVEEEASVATIIDQLLLTQENGASILFIDKHLGERKND
ncbi:MAG: ferritin [Parachlamydiales bacterium]|nr:ferritin [Parachlamydiales bacterium]